MPNFVEVISFQSITGESKREEWPDLQLHFISTALNSNFMSAFRFKKEVVCSNTNRTLFCRVHIILHLIHPDIYIPEGFRKILK